MTQKEKAKDLVDKFLKCKDVSNSYYVIPIMEDAKQCALIAVDEILEVMGSAGVYNYANPRVEIYLQEVKQEIENL